MFKVNNKNTITTSKTSFWCFYCELLTYFTSFPRASIIDFEQVKVSWITQSKAAAQFRFLDTPQENTNDEVLFCTASDSQPVT